MNAMHNNHIFLLAQPAESKFKITKAKPRAPPVDPDQALAALRDAIRERGSMRGLQLSFHRNRCSWKSVDGTGGVDIRGFQESLETKGIALSGVSGVTMSPPPPP